MISQSLLAVSGLFALSTLAFVTALLLQWRLPPVDAGREAAVAPSAIAAQKASGAPELRRQLFHAGFDHPQAAQYYQWAKMASALLGAVLGAIATLTIPSLQEFTLSAQIGVVFVAAAIFYYIPIKVVDRRQAAYLKRIALGLPDALDFMLVSVEAGQSADMSVMRVAEELAPVHPDLAAQFASLTEALAAGAAREDAWPKMAAECGNDDLRQLASIIVQSTTMGTPVAHTLRVFASDLRDQHVRRVEERANLLPTKMTLGTMMFTIPPLLILLLSPAIYKITQSF